MLSQKNCRGLIAQTAALALVVFGPVASSAHRLATMQTVSASTTSEEMISYIEDVASATAFRYQARDSAGNVMDTAKIIADPKGGYMAVYHTWNGSSFSVKLATSSDLINWEFQTDYGAHASQPYLTAVDDGGFVMAWEADTNGSPNPYTFLTFRYYRNRKNLLKGKADLIFDAPHTQVPPMRWAEGTPNIYSVTLSPDIEHSTIDVGFHYFQNGDVDRQARGTLTDFSSWKAQRETQIDDAILAFGVNGNIGDRDNLTFRGSSFNLHEAQYVRGDFGSWRSFLWDWSTNSATQLKIRTHSGSTAFANPSFTTLIAPSGDNAIVITLFIPSEGAAPGESGELIYYRTYGK